MKIWAFEIFAQLLASILDFRHFFELRKKLSLVYLNFLYAYKGVFVTNLVLLPQSAQFTYFYAHICSTSREEKITKHLKNQKVRDKIKKYISHT